MELYEILWKSRYLEKLVVKHGVTTDEVESILFGHPFVRYWEKGKVQGENLYVAYGQTVSGRYLVIFFIHKEPHTALPISARDMTVSERRYYRGQKAP